MKKTLIASFLWALSTGAVFADDNTNLTQVLEACDEGAVSDFCTAADAYVNELLETRSFIEIGLDDSVYAHLQSLLPQ